MKITVQLVIEPDDGTPTVVTEVASLQRTGLTPETLGLTLAEAKNLRAHCRRRW